MGVTYTFKVSLLSMGLLGAGLRASAQLAMPDSVRGPVPPRVLLKAGLRLTHFSYTPGSQTWRVVVPFSLGAEYRVAPRFGFYSLAEVDLQATRAIRRRRQVTALPSATLSLGLRYYYTQPTKGRSLRDNNLYGTYLALEGNVERQVVTASYANLSRGQTPTSLTPGVYAFWGTQHPFRRVLLYDINAGLGFQAPAYYNFESVTRAHYDVAAQVNLRLYWGVGF